MAASLSQVKIGSLVHRFITSGKPGNCKLCNKFVEKLEAHHTSYSPEITIKLCHNCHHKTHFWTNRLTEKERRILLLTKHDEKIVNKLMAPNVLGVHALHRLIAPSRQVYIKKHILKDSDVNKQSDIPFLKRIKK